MYRWNHFDCNISEENIRDAADRIVELGLADAGYKFVNVDDCWHHANRDEEGRLQADETKFSKGMKALGDYIHEKGLKFGIYSDAGYVTCEHYCVKRRNK